MLENIKKCPYCKEEIRADAIRCKHCHMMLNKESSVSDGSDVASAGPLDDAVTRLPDDVGRVLSDRFEIRELIAEGGFGKVYRAYDGVMKIDVAIKELSDRFEKDRKAVRFLLSEAKAAHALAHPRIAKFDYYDEKGNYLLMEYVPGLVVGDAVCHDVAQLLEARGGKLSEEEATRIILQLLEALQYAHGLPEPVIHRDIKPQNLLLDAQGNVKVCDFGIAKVVRESVSRYGIPDTSGTLMYMSPEQCVGRGVDARSDIYSLGVTLYELLSGRTPFEDAEDVTYCHINVEPEPIRGVGDRLNEIVLKCLAKKPEDRWQNARELADALEGKIETDSERREKEGARAALRKQEEERKRREKEEAERKAKEEAARRRELEESRRLGEEEERRQKEIARRFVLPSIDHEEAARQVDEEKQRKEADRKAREMGDKWKKIRAPAVTFALIYIIVGVVGGGIIYYRAQPRKKAERARREAAVRYDQQAKTLSPSQDTVEEKKPWIEFRIDSSLLRDRLNEITGKEKLVFPVIFEESPFRFNVSDAIMKTREIQYTYKRKGEVFGAGKGEFDRNTDIIDYVVLLRIFTSSKIPKDRTKFFSMADYRALGEHLYLAVVSSGTDYIDQLNTVSISEPSEFRWEGKSNIPWLFCYDFDGNGLDEICLSYIQPRQGPYSCFEVYRLDSTMRKLERIVDKHVNIVDPPYGELHFDSGSLFFTGTFWDDQRRTFILGKRERILP